MSDIIKNDEVEIQTSLNNQLNVPDEIYQNSQKEINKIYNNIIENTDEQNYISNINQNIEDKQLKDNNENEINDKINIKIHEISNNDNENNIIQNHIYNDIEENQIKDNEIKIEINNNPENMNKINIESNNDDENNTNIETIKINEYLEQENIKSNKEYNDDDNDSRSCRLTARDNNEKYLLIQDENEKNGDEEQKEDLFPFRIVGDARKKSEHLGKYNSRYLELDSMKGLFKRYMSCKDYPKNPREIIDIRNFKLLKKYKKVKDFYDLEITYTKTKKNGDKVDKVEIYRLRHVECRNKWHDSLLAIWKYLAEGSPVPKFTKNLLLFVDDRIGIIQEIGKKKKENNKQEKSEINLKKFKILNLLGVGGFGTVFKVKHILTDKIYAMKVMNKNYVIKKKYLHYIVSEFQIMKLLGGFPFVLDLHYCFQSANYLYLIIDYCPNGDFTKLKSINNLKLFFAEVILAFEHIHNHNVIYRDLKPENILLDTSGHIRVCDFNLAKAGMTKNKRADSFCGSPMYFSPEMVLGKGVDYKCDIYGIGLLIYELATGKPAYTANNLKSLYELIKKNKINFNISGLHGDIKDLIEKILVKEPSKRLDLEDIKQHPYFKDIDFDKVLRKEYGKIETEKIKKKENNIDEEKNNNLTDEEKEKLAYEKFQLQQQKLDENKNYTFLQGKISVKEMILDQKRPMKNYVREFYYVKKEDIEQTSDFKLDVKESVDITPFIMDNYEYEV